MTPFDRLYQETAPARERFLAIPLVKEALEKGGPRGLYLAFLTEAYHHVKHTFPLLAFASARTRYCSPSRMTIKNSCGGAAKGTLYL